MKKKNHLCIVGTTEGYNTQEYYITEKAYVRNCIDDPWFIKFNYCPDCGRKINLKRIIKKYKGRI